MNLVIGATKVRKLGNLVDAARAAGATPADMAGTPGAFPVTLGTVEEYARRVIPA